jgi:triosephosphate isomerase
LNPLFVVNFKTYVPLEEELKVAKAIESHTSDLFDSLVAVPPSHIYPLSRGVSISVLAQHVDPVGSGAFTGCVTPRAVKEVGAEGTLLNHSEKRLKLADIAKALELCKEEGLLTICCSNNVATSKALAALSPDYVAIEPPELIGGDVAVSTAQPEIVTKSVREVKKIDARVGVLCGAGIKTGEDVSKALDLGAEGVLLASGVVKAKDLDGALDDLISGFRL